MSTLAPIGVAPAYKYVNQAAFNVCDTYCCRNINAAVAIPLSLLNVALCPLKGVGVFIHEIADLNYCGALIGLGSNIWDGVKSIVLTAVLVVLLVVNIFSPVNLYGCLKQKPEIEKAFAIEKLTQEDRSLGTENSILRSEIDELNIRIVEKNNQFHQCNDSERREKDIKRELEDENAELDEHGNKIKNESRDLISSLSSPSNREPIAVTIPLPQVKHEEPIKIERMPPANECPRTENNFLKLKVDRLMRNYIDIQIAVQNSINEIVSLMEINSKLRDENKRLKSLREWPLPPTTLFGASHLDASPLSPFTPSPIRFTPSQITDSPVLASRFRSQPFSGVSLFSPPRSKTPFVSVKLTYELKGNDKVDKVDPVAAQL